MAGNNAEAKVGVIDIAFHSHQRAGNDASVTAPVQLRSALGLASDVKGPRLVLATTLATVPRQGGRRWECRGGSSAERRARSRRRRGGRLRSGDD